MLPAFSEDVRFRAVVETGSLQALTDGLEAYANRDFERAIDLIGTARVPSQYEDFKRIYLASSLAWTKRFGEAVEILEKVPIEMLPEPWRGEAGWTLYVSLKESDQKAPADSVLNILAQSPGDVGERARQVLD
jgi:hypothetical protein